MKAFAAVIREILGLFVDDEGLALAIIGVVAIGCALAFLLHASPALIGAELLLGCLGALSLSALKAGRRRD